MKSPRYKHLSRRSVWLVVSGMVAVFVLVNVVLWAWYDGRSYPNTTVGNYTLGSVRRSQITGQLSTHLSLPKNLHLAAGNKSYDLATKDLGVSVNYQQTADAVMANRAWLPIANLWRPHHIASILQANQATLQTVLAGVTANPEQAPQDATITLQNGSFAITPDSAGFKLDNAGVSRQVLAGLQQGSSAIRLHGKIIPAKVTTASLRPVLADLQAQLQTAITIKFNSQTKRLTTGDLASWFVSDHNNYSLSPDLVKRDLGILGAGYGITVGNLDQLTADIPKALAAHKAADLTAKPAQPSKIMSYCTALRGVDASNLPALNARLLSAYADPRGWSLGGLVAFKHVDSGCDFSVWLASADQMASFGSICDDGWSCTVPPNIIINFSRWQNATDSWNAAHAGSIDEYRAMAINHETGHELGWGHVGCLAAGTPAPVMEQQSINLQGCVFNAWPLPSEQANERARLGL